MSACFLCLINVASFVFIVLQYQFIGNMPMQLQAPQAQRQNTHIHCWCCAGLHDVGDCYDDDER